MKVKIGRYPKLIGPYHIAEKLLFFLNPEKDPIVDKLGEWLATSWTGNSDSLLYKLCNKIYEFRERKVSIKIDRFDTWNAEQTLSLIIVPLLAKFIEEWHALDLSTPVGLKYDPDIMPEDLKDAESAEIWKWILEEMLWAHQQVVEDNWDEQFFTGECKYITETVIDEEGRKWKYFKQDDENSTFEFDKEGFKVYDGRVSRGLSLFGKYYRNLWL